MGNLSMILGGSPSILRDMKVSLVNAATSERREVTPFLDGTIKIANIEPGNWQVVAKHPNLLFDVVNRPIRIFPDRPTFTRIPIPENIFSNSAVGPILVFAGIVAAAVILVAVNDDDDDGVVSTVR